MMERNKLKLNKVYSQRGVNKDLYQNISLSNDSKILPYNDIVKVINEDEEFNKERQAASTYRLVNTVNSLFTNVLFNTTGVGSWGTFNEPLFRDRSYPPNGISTNETEDYTYEESIEAHLKERDGWFGYDNPKIYEYNNHEFTYMEPSKDKFDLVIKEGDQNWGVTMTYPASKLSNELTQGGLDIVSFKLAIIGGKEMTAVGIPYKHNLKLNDDVRITNTTNDGVYQVMRIGLDNGDLKENYFVIDVPIETLELNESKFQKVSYGKECEYYFRVFRRVNNQDQLPMSDKDFDSYPLAFSKSMFSDNVIQLATKKDIDVKGLSDNLGRPISEIFLTFIKNNNKGFSDVKSGLLLNNLGDSGTHEGIPDVRRIHNGLDTPFKSNKPLEASISFNDDEYVGDLVEYNINTLNETVLADVHHRFNTLNRENGGTIVGNSITSTISTPISKPISNILVDDGSLVTRDNFISYDDLIFTEKKFTEDINSVGSFSYPSISLTYSSTLSDTPCLKSNNKTYYCDIKNFRYATQLYTSSSGSNIAGNGYYSDGYYVRFWDSKLGKFGLTEVCGTQSSTTQTPSTTTNQTTEESVFVGGRQEGYFYKPFQKIKLRVFSNYIETGDENTYGIPDYAEKLVDGRYVWRDIMDIGFNETGLDYPFLNGSHYIHNNMMLGLRRQDPFDDYGLYYKGEIPDIGGVKVTNNKKINKSGDVC